MTKARTAAAMVLYVAALAALTSCAEPPGTSKASRNPLCAELSRRVGDYRGLIIWDNGITRSEANWHTVLKDGATQGTWSNRRELAGAVRSDQRGYEKLLATVPPAERGYFNTLHARISAPQVERVPDDPATAQASLFVGQLAAARCNYA